MQIETEIKKWGNSLALRITGAMAELPHFREGTQVIVDINEEGLSIKPAPVKEQSFKLPYSESQLLDNISSHTVHADNLFKPNISELDYQ